MLLAVLVLVRWAASQDPVGSGEWLSDPARRQAVKVAMQLVPLAGIAFLTTAIMLLVTHVVPWLELLFPAWALVLSVHILVTDMRVPEVSHPPS